MKTFDIGPGVPCDLDILLNTRLLVQANSGAGKSWLLRRLLEQTSGQVQQIVIDPEGEFATLRERFDYVLAAKTGGDTLADPRTAKLLAERLLELGVSAVLDIYELKAHERVRFVRLFLEALVDAPKRLWHPALVILDEAHVYAPEKGSAESLQSVIDLATRGRKRGFCLVQATQRLSKLHKDAAAEANNKLIGRSALDVDMERAGDELGLTKTGRQVLRDLDAGEFFAFGPALTRTVTRVKVGAVQTRHPKAGSKLSGVVPPPTEKVKAVLSKLADLPAEAEEREKSIAELRQALTQKDRRIKELERATSLSSPSNEGKKPEVKVIEKPVITDAQLAKAEALVGRLEATIERAGDLMAKPLGTVRAQLQDLVSAVKAVRQPALPLAPSRLTKPIGSVVSRNMRPVVPVVNPRSNGGGPQDLSGPELKILTALAELEALGMHPADKQQLGLLAGYTNVRSGGFSEPLGRLIAGGYAISPAAGRIAITDAGRGAVGPVSPPATPEEMQARVMVKLTGPEQKLLRVILQHYPDPVGKEALGEACGYTNIRSGGFSEPLGRLNTLGIIQKTPVRGEVVASPALFLEA